MNIRIYIYIFIYKVSRWKFQPPAYEIPVKSLNRYDTKTKIISHSNEMNECIIVSIELP